MTRRRADAPDAAERARIREQWRREQEGAAPAAPAPAPSSPPERPAPTVPPPPPPRLAAPAPTRRSCLVIVHGDSLTSLPGGAGDRDGALVDAAVRAGWLRPR